jgi:hypothetical protein
MVLKKNGKGKHIFVNVERGRDKLMLKRGDRLFLFVLRRGDR